MSTEKYYVYLLKCNNNNRTYIGSTNNLSRRIRQHNGEISGGAKSTSGESWKFAFYMTGFRDHSEALQAEWRFKRPVGNRNVPRIYSGIEGRFKGLKLIMENSKGWTSNSLPFLPEYQYYISEEYAPLAANIPRLIPLEEQATTA